MKVIVICIDTLRRDYLRCYDAGALTWTPHIDAFAERATRFDMAFCGSFPTVPIRVDAYTGDVNWPRYGWKGPDSEQRTLPQILREHGYYTGLVLDTRNNVSAGLHNYYDEYHLIDTPPSNTVKPEEIVFPFPRENARQNGTLYARDMASTAHYRYEADWFVARTMMKACEWLEDNYRRDNLFLWVDTFEPHEVWNAPDHYTERFGRPYAGIDYSYPNYGPADRYQPEELGRMQRRYAAEIELTDRWVGHLLQQIELMTTFFADTVIILMGDHGMYFGEHGHVGKHTVDPTDPWPLLDEVARVPFLVLSPWLSAPQQTEALIQFADLMPTVLDICLIPPKAPYGRSFLPVLQGETDRHREQVFSSCHSWDGPGRIDYLRSLITVTTPEWSLVVGPEPHQPQLFDRQKDPGLHVNFAVEQPEVVRQLRSALAEFMRDRGADPEYIRTFALGEG